MARREDGTTTEIFELYLFRNLLVHFKIGFYFAGVFQGYFVGIPNVFRIIIDDLADAPDFEIAFIDVYDDVEIFVNNILFPYHRSDHVFEDADHGGAIDTLLLGKFGERFD